MEFNIKSFNVKIVSKNASELVIAKQLISNLFLIAYNLFLSKNRINIAIKAHKHTESIAERHGAGRIFGHYWTSSGVAISFA